MPEAAPLTITRLPSYPSTSFIAGLPAVACPLAVPYSIVIACSGQLSAPIRACARSASATCSSSTTQ